VIDFINGLPEKNNGTTKQVRKTAPVQILRIRKEGKAMAHVLVILIRKEVKTVAPVLVLEIRKEVKAIAPVVLVRTSKTDDLKKMDNFQTLIVPWIQTPTIRRLLLVRRTVLQYPSQPSAEVH